MVCFKPGLRKIANMMKSESESSEHFLVGLSGNGASGKTTLCNSLKEYLDFSYVNLDGYYYDSELRHEKNMTGAHPESFDKAKVLKHLKALKDGEEISMPLEEGGFRKVKSSKTIIVDGFSAFLLPGWKELFDLTIFLDCPEEIVKERKYSSRIVDEEFERVFKLRMEQYEKYVKPKMEEVDHIVRVI